MSNTVYRPKFTELGKVLVTPHQTSEQNIKATEIIQREKEKELRTDSRARQWESDRKKEWHDNKPYYMKSRQKKDPTQSIMDEIYNGGKFKSLVPAINFLLVKVDKEDVTDNGILLPSDSKASNTGVIIETSQQCFLPNGNVSNMPYKKGNHILYRKFAGMEVEINDNKLLMLTFQDILAQIEV